MVKEEWYETLKGSGMGRDVIGWRQAVVHSSLDVARHLVVV